MPTKKAASPSPVSKRNSTAVATVVANRLPRMPRPTSTHPHTTTNRRPLESPSGPTSGRATAADRPNPPTASPTATGPPPRSFSTKPGNTGYTIPSDTK